MGRRGPPPKDPELKRRQGTYRKDRDRDRGTALTLPAGAPPIPEGLSGEARELWVELVPQLLEAGTLAKVDGGALEAYCRCFVHWKELETAAREQPLVKTPFGPKLNPAGEEARKLSKDVLQPLMFSLVLHHAARSRVKLPAKPQDPDPNEKFLFAPLTAIPGGKSGPPDDEIPN